MALQRYQDEYSGCEENPDGQYVRLDDVVALKEKLLHAMEETYRDMYDDDDYVTAKFDLIDNAKHILKEALDI